MIIPIKILILGDSGVGKTSLCSRYMNDNYLESYKPTVGVDLCSKNVMSPSGKHKFRFQFWEICGEDRYLNMSNMYYKNATFCLIMFDLVNLESFKACAKWKRDLDEKYQMEHGKKCPCLLIGNKNDMPYRVLDQFDIEDFCRDYEIDGYMEISVKNDIMVKETIDYVVNVVMKKKETELDEKLINSTISSPSLSTTATSIEFEDSFNRSQKEQYESNLNENNVILEESIFYFPVMLFLLFTTSISLMKRFLLRISWAILSKPYQMLTLSLEASTRGFKWAMSRTVGALANKSPKILKIAQRVRFI